MWWVCIYCSIRLLRYHAAIDCRGRICATILRPIARCRPIVYPGTEGAHLLIFIYHLPVYAMMYSVCPCYRIQVTAANARFESMLRQQQQSAGGGGMSE